MNWECQGVSKSVRLASLGIVASFVVACGERPPVDSVQRGYRGTGMVQITNPRATAAKEVTNVVPAPIPPVKCAASPGQSIGWVASDQVRTRVIR